MSESLQVWIRNDKGQVYGPLTPPSVELLIDNGIISGRLQVSTNGDHYVYPGRVPGLRMIFPRDTWGDTVVPGDELDAEWSKVALPAALPGQAPPVSSPGASAAPAAGPAFRAGPGVRPGGPVAGPGSRPPPGRPMSAAQTGPRPLPPVARTSSGSVPGFSPGAAVPTSRPSVADFMNGPGAPTTPRPAGPSVAEIMNSPEPAAPSPVRSSGSGLHAAVRSSGSGLHAAVAPAGRPPSAAAPVRPVGAVEMPSSGTLGAPWSAQQLYYLAAATERTGLLTLVLGDRELVVHFKKGSPEFFDSTHTEDSLDTFLVAQRLIAPAQLEQARAQSAKFGGELLPALFGLGLLNPNAVFQHLGQRASQLLFRALTSEQGTFAFDLEELPAARSMPLGNRWAVYLEALRRVPGPDLKRRLMGEFELPVMKAGGLVPITDLRLTPQEARAFNYFDGVRSLAQLVRDLPGEADTIVRTAWMLGPLELVSFAGVSPTAAKHAPPPVQAQPPPPTVAPPVVPPRPPPPVIKAPGGDDVARGTAPAQPGPAPLRPPVMAPAQPAAPQRPPPVVAPAQPGTPQRPPPPAIKAPGDDAGRGMAPQVPGNPAQMPKVASPYPGAAASRPPPVMAPAAPKAAAPTVAPTEDLKQLQALHDQLKAANYFDVLGVKRDADANQVKIAYLKAARSYHPDTVPPGSPEALGKLKADIFARIGEANRTLSDPKLKADYVAELDAGGTGSKVDIEKILRAEEVFQKGRILVQARKYPDAVKMFDEAITANPDEPEFFAWRGYAKYLGASDKKAASADCLKEIKLCVDKNPNVAAAHYFLGYIAKANGDAKTALAEFKKTVALDPKHIDAARELRNMK